MSTHDPRNPSDAGRPGVEERLRDAVHAYADTADPTPGAWARLRAAADAQARPRRSRLPIIVLAGAAVAGAAVTAGVLLTRDTADRGVKVIPPATEVPSVPTTAYSPSATNVTTPLPTTPPVVPDVTGIVASTTEGRVVLLDTDGTELRTLIEATEGRQVTELQVAPNGILWYLSKPAGQRWSCGDLYRVALEHGSPERVASAADFALSSDGARLAYIVRGGVSGDVGCTLNEEAATENLVVVEVLATGDRIVFENAPTTDHAPDYPDTLAWSPDGSRLATSLCWEGCSVAILGPEAGLLEDAPGIEGDGETYFPTWTADGQLVAQEYCCFPEYTDGSRVAVFDPATGARLEELDAFGDTPFWGLWAGPAEAQYAGSFLLLYSDSSLLRWEPPAEPELVATDVLTAAWAFGVAPSGGPLFDPTDETVPKDVAVPTTIPAGTCSAAVLADDPWPQGAPLPTATPGPVVDKVQQVHDAAVTCEWDALVSLMVPEFSYSFGGNLDADEAIAAWQEAEDAGEPILATVVETISDPSPTERDGYWIFGDADGLGYRAGFTAAGEWTYFVAGD